MKPLSNKDNYKSELRTFQLMGVLNVTPDSFYDGGMHYSLEKAIEHGLKMAQEGADIIDIGGASSRPFAPFVSEEEELNRVIPVIEALAKTISTPLSIDTDKSKVARKAVQSGVTLINCIRGFSDPEMLAVAAGCEADLCVMHMQGTPETMQINPSYPNGVVPEIMAFFEKQIELLTRAGIVPERIILDPGIGFGLTVEHTLEIFDHLKKFKKFGLRLLIGASRKSFLSKLLMKPATELLPATLAIHTMAICNGADIIRVHDVAEHRDIMNLLSHML